MYRQMVMQQWNYSSGSILGFLVLAFALPLVAVYFQPAAAGGPGAPVGAWLKGAANVGYVIPVLAMLCGGALGLGTWMPDRLGRHVYVLSLPLERWRLVLLRFAAGSTLVAAPVVALAAGATLATLAVDLPAGVHAYPLQLTLRFALATLVCFAMFFAGGAASRRALIVAGLGVVGLVSADVILIAIDETPVVIENAFKLLLEFPGPFSILRGRWALFDV